MKWFLQRKTNIEKCLKSMDDNQIQQEQNEGIHWNLNLNTVEKIVVTFLVKRLTTKTTSKDSEASPQ